MRTSVMGALLVLPWAHAIAADITEKQTDPASEVSSAPGAYNWTGFYLGGHMGYAWGKSNWRETTPGDPSSSASGSFGTAMHIDSFNEAGSFFGGAQAGYNYMFRSRVVMGVEADVSFPAYPNKDGNAITGTSNFTTNARGAESFSENVFASGTVRGRVGYAPGNWLFYGTGGLAWSYNQFSLTQNNITEQPYLWRLGWAAGAGLEGPIAPHWTARLEYLYTGYGNSTKAYSLAGQRFTSDLNQQEIRLGLSYQFNDNTGDGSTKDVKLPSSDTFNVHGQTTLTWQGYPSIRSPYQGTNSLPGGGEGRETVDATLAVGMKLWKGAELWVDPEIDQGFGVGNTHGAAGYPSGESYKLGQSEPYARVQRYFIRQTFDLGGEQEKIEADFNQFAGSQTSNRVVLTFGKFAVVDVFDTNKYANNPKTDFLNWSLINAGTFDYAGDAWGYSYGAAAEWYQGHWTVRGGIFDLSQTPAGGNSPLAYGLDPTFSQFQLVGEIEHRHELWGEPGKIKITGFLSRGRAGSYQDAVNLAQATNQPADITLVRDYKSRPGVSFNLEQQIMPDVGFFARAGWADGRVEPWDFTDIDRSASAGFSINGKRWGRPEDTIGFAGVLNGISKVHQEFFNAGGTGLLIGDGALPKPGTEKIFEAYYNYAISSSTKLSFDYQFIDNPAYNTERGPANFVAGRLHWQF